MKNYLLFIIILFIQVNLFSLKLLNEIKLDRIDNFDYSYIRSADYNIITQQLVIAPILPNITPNTQIKTTDKTFAGVFVFSNEGKLLGKVGKFNSYEKDGIISVHRVKLIDGLINVSDYTRKKLLIFSNKKPFNFLYSIDNIVSPVRAQIDFVKNNTAFFLDTNNYIINNKNIRTINKFMRVAIGKVVNTNISYVKQVTDVRRLYSFKNEFFGFWNDKNLMKNNFLKKYLKELRNLDTDTNVALYDLGMYRLGPIFADLAGITFNDKNNTFFILNAFGTKINNYNFKGTLIDSFIIRKYQKLKFLEMEKYKRLWTKKLKNKSQLKKFINKYNLSYSNELLYDKKNNNLIIRYFLRNTFLKLTNLPKAKTYLLVYSLDKHKAVSDFIPINFIPVNFDSDKRELIGVQQRDNDIYLQFYKWEY